MGFNSAFEGLNVLLSELPTLCLDQSLYGYGNYNTEICYLCLFRG